MSTETVERVYTLLAFASLAFVVFVAVGALLQAAGVGRLGSAVAELLDGVETLLAWIVALAATLGSLYFSEVADFVPCELCWFQRIAMYPLAVVLLMALVRRERGIAPYAIALSLLGFVVSVYHYQLEWFPEQATFCSTAGSVPCTVVWFKVYGVGTLPMLAGSAFLLVATLQAIAWRNERLAAAYAGGEGAADVGESTSGLRLDEESSGLGRTSALAAAAGLGVLAVVAVAGVLLYLVNSDGEASDGRGTTVVVAGDPEAGSAVFVSAGCGACHAFRPAGSSGTQGASLDGTTLSEAEIRAVVADGRNAMVGYRHRLSDQELADVAAYVARG